MPLSRAPLSAGVILPVVFVPTAQAGARLVERWAFYYARETVAGVNDLWRARS